MMKKTLITVLFYFVILILEILGDRFWGPNFRGNLFAVEPLTWKEIFGNIYEYLIYAFVLTIVLGYILINAERQEKTNIENARKRIEKRRKDKKLRN